MPLVALIVLLLCIAPVAADERPATILVDTPILSSASGTKIANGRAGEVVLVSLCLSLKPYCLLEQGGYIDANAIQYEGSERTVLEDDRRWWNAIRAARHIRTEGDSYMGGACGVHIKTLIERSAPYYSVTNTALGGSEITGVRDRVLDPENAALLPYITVFWDGRQNGYTTTEEYVATLAEAINALDHERFIVIPPGVPFNIANPTEEADIRRAFLARWPANTLDWRGLVLTVDGNRFDPVAMCDDTHLSESGLRSVAEAINAFIIDKGW